MELIYVKLEIKSREIFLEQNFSDDYICSFDDVNGLRIKETNNEKEDIAKFYGDHIESIKLILGRNGKGKTTLLDAIGCPGDEINFYSYDRFLVVYLLDNGLLKIDSKLMEPKGGLKGREHLLTTFYAVLDKSSPKGHFILDDGVPQNEYNELISSNHIYYLKNSVEQDYPDFEKMLFEQSRKYKNSLTRNYIYSSVDNTFDFFRSKVFLEMFCDIKIDNNKSFDYEYYKNQIYEKNNKKIILSVNESIQSIKNVLVNFKLLNAEDKNGYMQVASDFLYGNGDIPLMTRSFSTGTHLCEKFIIFLLERYIFKTLDIYGKNKYASQAMFKYDKMQRAINERKYNVFPHWDYYDRIDYLKHIIETIGNVIEQKAESIKRFVELVLEYRNELSFSPSLNLIIDCKASINVKEIIEQYKNDSQFLSLGSVLKDHLDGMSSGEAQLVKIIASISKVIKNNMDNAIIVLDEPDVGMHPEWNRRLIFEIVRLFDTALEKDTKRKFEIIISSHSPFVASDIRREDIYLLDKFEDETRLIKANRGFASNIGELFIENFVLDYPIGAFAEKKIGEYSNKIIYYKNIKDKKEHLEECKTFLKECKMFIDEIDEPVLHVGMTNELEPLKNEIEEIIKEQSKNDEIAMLEIEIKKMKIRLDALRGTQK